MYLMKSAQQNGLILNPILRNVILLVLCLCLSSCYFFRKRDVGSDEGVNTSGTLGQPIGARAGGLDEAALALVHGVHTEHAPASIRPDPDTYIRNLLLQYRQEGVTVAREIGRVEAYRALLGGASEDFATMPQLSYDATSVLASYKVAEEVCRGLVAPDLEQHPGWDSILPAAPGEAMINIEFLAQRFIGLPSERIPSLVIDHLLEIYDLAAEETGYGSFESYIPVCAALALDAEAMLL